MEKLISLLPNLNKGEEYLFYPFSFIPEKKEGETEEPREVKGISIKNANNEKIEKAYTNAKKSKEGVITEGDIPYLEFAQRADGKIRPTAVTQEAKTNTLIQFMLKEIGKGGRLAWSKEDPSTSSGSRYTPLGKSVPVDTTQVVTKQEPVAQQKEPIMVYEQEKPVGSAVQPNKAFETPVNVTIASVEDLDDDEDMPF
jgi:hypothetical protein